MDDHTTFAGCDFHYRSRAGPPHQISTRKKSLVNAVSAGDRMRRILKFLIASSLPFTYPNFLEERLVATLKVASGSVETLEEEV
jgi:hypothetical protein